MALTLTIELTNEQQALMVDVARSVLGPGAKANEMREWAQQVAADGLAAEVERVGVADIDTDAREQQNTARRAFIASVKQAWPEPEPEQRAVAG